MHAELIGLCHSMLTILLAGLYLVTLIRIKDMRRRHSDELDVMQDRVNRHHEYEQSALHKLVQSEDARREIAEEGDAWKKAYNGATDDVLSQLMAIDEHMGTIRYCVTERYAIESEDDES